MTNIFSRLFKNWATNLAEYRSPFSQEIFEKIQSAIVEGEKKHLGQIKIIIEKTLSLSDILHGKTSYERTLELFGRYKIWNTPRNTGLLLYINLADRKIEIIVDRGISTFLENHIWQKVCSDLAIQFKQKNFELGLLQALSTINTILTRALPKKTAEPNSIDDDPILL